MEVNIVKKSIKVTVDGASYDVKKPTNRQLKMFTEATIDNDKQGIDKTITLLSELGLPENISWELDPESLQDIIGALMPVKKN